MADSPTTVFTSPSTQTSLYASTSPPKRKRRPAGTPDPDAEVIALSPKTLMESDRYVCEICNQGFQRDQNLQMHRRRHKVPWKLLRRVDPEVRKRVYVCPEPSCLHHNPCHALGDLVGIKKHYRRKHSSMKQWECDKCSKAYAVQSDYKAHVKTCGTRGHCCDCGRVFSRVESFIEHQDTCTAARNKKGSASSDLEAASLPSLAVPAPAYHATIMLTNPSNFAEKVIKDNYHHNGPIINSLLKPLGQDRGDIPSRPLPPQISPSPASPSALAMNAHACIMIPAIAPPQISPTLPLVNAAALPRHSSLSMAASMHSQATHNSSISWETHQPCMPHNHLILQDHKAELQLLPTSKPLLNQLESSQSSVTWGKDITSTNSTTSGTCSSPASKTVDDKRAHKGADSLEMLLMSGAASTATDHTPCTLQLSIGLSNNDHFAYSERSTTLHVSRDLANQEDKSETLDSKATRMPWLAWSAAPLAQRRNDSCHDVPNIGVASSCTSDGKQGITCRIDAYKDAIDLELSAGFDDPCSSVRLNRTGATNPHSSDLHHQSSLEDKVHRLQKRQDRFLSRSKTVGSEAAAGFTDKNSTKPSHSLQDEEVTELLHATQRSCKRSLDPKGAEEAKLLWRNSTCESIAAPDVSNQPQTEQSNSLLGLIEEPGHVSELLQHAEYTPNFSLGTSVAQKPNFSLRLDMNAPAAAQAAEALLQKAREKLRKASADKLEAEKAWREARREREQAEEELAKAQRIAEYNRMIALGKAALVQHAEKLQEEVGATRKPTCSSSTTSSSPFNSMANSQASSSPLQIMQLHAGGALCSAPSFITCPTCHRTSQILYPSPNNAGTLFLASPLELAPPSTLISTPQIKLPSSPTS